MLSSYDMDQNVHYCDTTTNLTTPFSVKDILSINQGEYQQYHETHNQSIPVKQEYVYPDVTYQQAIVSSTPPSWETNYPNYYDPYGYYTSQLMQIPPENVQTDNMQNNYCYNNDLSEKHEKSIQETGNDQSEHENDVVLKKSPILEGESSKFF